MTVRRPVLMDRAQIEELIERSLALFDAYDGGWGNEDPDDPDHTRNRNEAIGAALEGLRFAAVAIEWLRDPALTASLNDVVANFDGWDLHADSHAQVLASAITEIARAGAPVRELHDFATNKHGVFRCAVAQGLEANSDESSELLGVLSADADPGVRNAAREKLAKVREIPWWRGKFSRDPAEGLSARDAKRLKATLQELAKLLDTQVEGERMGRVAKLLDKLPDAAAVDGAEHVMRMLSRHSSADQPVLGVMLRRAGGSEAFLRYVQEATAADRPSSWLLFHHTDLTPIYRRLDVDRQEDLGQKMFSFALTAPHGETVSYRSAWDTAAKISAEAWPSTTDLTPVLDALLEAAEGTEEHTLRGTALCAASAVFSREGVSVDAVADRILTARLEGYPGSWALFQGRFDEVIARMPRERVRVFAERSLVGEHRDTLTWALQNLLGPLHDPARDPSHAELAARFYETPRYRAAMWSDHKLQRCAFPLLRRDLRAGTISFEGAAGAMTLIDRLWGGGHEQGLIDGLLSDRITTRREKRKRDEADPRAEARAEHSAFLGPEEMRGPITDDERAQWRRIRDRAIEDGTVDWRPALEIVPPGAALPEDRTALDRAIALWREGSLDDNFAIAGAIARQPTTADLAVLDKMIRDDESNRDMLKTARQHARRGLGMPAIPPRAEAAADAPAVAPPDDDDWGDERDDA